MATTLAELRRAPLAAKVLWTAAVLVGLVDAYHYYRRGIFGLDFEPAWAAANALLHGRTHWQAFVYLPGCLVFVLPLAALPLHIARLIVYAIQFLGVAYAFWAMTRMVKISLGSTRIAGLALVLTLAGQVGVAANYENLTLLLLPFAVAFFVAVDRGHFLSAAVLVGVSITIKPLLILLLVVLVARRLWRETAIALLIPVVLTALVFAMSGHATQFAHEVANTFATHNEVSPVNVSLSGVLGYARTPTWAVPVVRLVVGLISVLAAWRINRLPVEGRGEQAIWLTTPLMVGLFLCFTFSWAYYAILLLPLVFVVINSLDRASWMVLVGVAAALLLPVLVDTIPAYPGSHASDWIASAGLLAVLAGAWIHGTDADRGTSGETPADAIVDPAP